MKDETLPDEKDKITLRKAIGTRVLQIRKHLGLKQGELSQRLNFGRANLSRIEKGAIFPSIPALAVLYKEFNISLPWILLGEGEMHTPKDPILNSLMHLGPEVFEVLNLMIKVSPFRHRMVSEYYQYTCAQDAVINHYFKLWQQTDHDAASVPGSTALSKFHARSVFYF